MALFNVLGLVSVFESSSFSRVEITKTLRSDGTAVNVARLERSVDEVLILPRWREHIWRTSSNLSNTSHFAVFVPDSVLWLQRIDSSLCLEIGVSNISIVQYVVHVVLVLSSIGSASMSLSSFGALDVLNIHNVSSGDVEHLLLHRSGAGNIVNTHLIPNEFSRLWLHVSDALEVIGRIQGVLT